MALVPQQLTDLRQGCAGTEKLGGEAVSEDVGAAVCAALDADAIKSGLGVSGGENPRINGGESVATVDRLGRTYRRISAHWGSGPPEVPEPSSLIVNRGLADSVL